MSEQSIDAQPGPAAYQRFLCDAVGLSLPDRATRFSAARFYSVANGESEWTDEERAVIANDPRLQGYESQMRDAVRQAKRGRAIIPLQRAVSNVPSERTLRPAARAACQASNDSVRLVSADGGCGVLLFAADENGHVTVRFFGDVPHIVGLMVGESPVEFIKPVDECGYACVLDEHIRPVLSGEAKLQIRTV